MTSSSTGVVVTNSELNKSYQNLTTFTIITYAKLNYQFTATDMTNLLKFNLVSLRLSNTFNLLYNGTSIITSTETLTKYKWYQIAIRLTQNNDIDLMTLFINSQKTFPRLPVLKHTPLG